MVTLKQDFEETYYAINVFSDCLYEYSKVIEKIVLEEKADALVNDFFFIAPYIISEKYNIPCIPIFHSGLPFSGDKIPPFGSGLPIGGEWGEEARLYNELSEKNKKLVIKRYKDTCKKMGVSNIKDFDLYKPYSRWLNLILTSKEIEAPRKINEKNTIFVGPCFSAKRKDVNDGFPYELINSDVKKVYVSLGTVFNNKPEIFKKILQGFEKENFQVIVSAGGAYSKLKKYNFNKKILIFKSVPQLEILKRVDIVISHGGNNTINETLAAGKPIIVMPIGGEQGDNASKIEYLNVGKRINIKNFTSDEVLEKVQAVLNEETYIQNANRIKEILNKTNCVDTSSKLIEWVAENKKPISEKGNKF